MTLASMCLLSTVGLLGACSKGVSYGDPKAPTGSQMQAVTSLNNIGGTVTTSVKGMGDGNGVFGVYNLMAGLQGTATNQASGVSGLSLAPEDLPMGCVTGTASTGFTYNHCDAGSGTTVNGSVQITTTSVTYALDISASISGVTDDITLKGTINDSGTRLSGNLEYKAHVSVSGLPGGLGGASADTTITGTWDIGFTESPACITDGTIEVTVDSSQGLHGARFLFSGCNSVMVQNG